MSRIEGWIGAGESSLQSRADSYKPKMALRLLLEFCGCQAIKNDSNAILSTQAGEQSGFRTRIAETVSVLLSAAMKH